MFAHFAPVATVVRMVLLRHMHPHFLVQSVRQGLTRGFEIVPCLEVHPELCLHPKETAQAQRGIRRDPSLPMDNLIDATRRHPDRFGQMVLADLHWLQEILQQDLPRMNRWKVALGHDLTSVIVDNLHVIGVTVTPHKAHAPLVVDTDAMLSSASMGQRLKAIARRHTEGIQHGSRMELFQRACGYPLDVLRQVASKLAAEDLFGCLALERFEHAESITLFVDNAKRYGCMKDNSMRLVLSADRAPNGAHHQPVS